MGDPKRTITAQQGTAKPPRNRPSRRLSGDLQWLVTYGNKIVRDGPAPLLPVPLLLRGVNRSGLEYASVSAVVPDGKAWLAAAGITLADIRTICVDWRANIIRLPFAQNHVLPPGTSAPAGDYLAALDQVIEWAAQHGAYTILDLQRIEPNVDTPELTDASSGDMWRVLFERYQDEPAVLFDLLNEPHSKTNNPADMANTLLTWHSAACTLIDGLRPIHPRSLIFLSGVDWAYDLQDFPLTATGGGEYQNIVYSTHVYPTKGSKKGPWTWTGPKNDPNKNDPLYLKPDPWVGANAPDGLTNKYGPDPNWFNAFGKLSATRPVFAGEWGLSQNEAYWPDQITWGKTLADYFEQLQLGWCGWSWIDRPKLRDSSGAPSHIWGDMCRSCLRGIGP